ncbi:flavin-containing monooxygenase [Mycolicibacterium sp. CBMA 334]|uniref:flavin-containing monooxygenase n=1 Tax=Mycolicibacterium sp. CBMA 334 TaxID=2606607 RepID=UPI0037CB04F5
MTEHFDVVIVGAGISGISTAWHLQDRCPTKSYVLLERRENIGGTWDLFKYPGIRSDSDMFTLGFRFKPWESAKAIADGQSIWNYINEAAAESGIDKHIRTGHKVLSADWSDADNKWTVTVEHAGEEKQITCSFVSVCSGYYNYDEGYSPEFPGAANFKGQIIHPQHWPEDLDYADKKIVVIGSGATAITLIHHAAAFAHLRRVTATGGPDRREDQQVPAEAHGALRQSVEGHRVQHRPVCGRPPAPGGVQAGAAEDGDPPTARGFRLRQAFQPALQPVG